MIQDIQEKEMRPSDNSTYHKSFLIGNWKMFDSSATLVSPSSFAHGLNLFLQHNAFPGEVVLCPPIFLFPSLASPNNLFFLGAQDCSAFSDSDHTGDTSASMLKTLAARYVIVGHSERRLFLGESSELIYKKLVQARHNALIPILCIGETEEEKEKGQTFSILEKQLNILESYEIDKNSPLFIAYEPVWAIGKNKVHLPLGDIHQVYEKINLFLGPKSKLIRFLYGGSVTSSLAPQLLKALPISGFLVGGASRQLDTFCAIARCFDC